MRSWISVHSGFTRDIANCSAGVRKSVSVEGQWMFYLALARKKGELVTKEQLFEAAWPDVFVHESNLKVTIAYLRRALREFSPSNEYSHDGCRSGLLAWYPRSA